MSYEDFDYNTLSSNLSVYNFVMEGCTWCELSEIVVDKVIRGDSDVVISEYTYLIGEDCEGSEFEKFQVTIAPTLIAITQEGKECTRIEGFVYTDELQEWIDNAKVICAVEA